MEHTKSEALAVGYKFADQKATNTSFALSPMIEAKKNETSAKVRVVEANVHLEKTKGGETTLSSDEYPLSCISTKNWVQWDLFRPRVAYAVQDFLSGTFRFYAIASWENNQKRLGSAKLSADRLAFYDVNRRGLGGFRSLLMWRTLRKAASRVEFKCGYNADFEVTNG